MTTLTMQLDIGSTGNGKAYLKFNAKTGKFSVHGVEVGNREMHLPNNFVADFGNMTIGWIRRGEGQPQQLLMDSSVHGKAPQPGEGFKRGFVVNVHCPMFGGTVEFASNADNVCNAIKDIYSQWLAGKASNPGKLPVLACKGVQAMKGKYGTNYRPIFTIVDWVDRPAELPNVSPVEVCDIWQGDTTAYDPPF
jgi:hypothetical protein